jgi:hypothetical protein
VLDRRAGATKRICKIPARLQHGGTTLPLRLKAADCTRLVSKRARGDIQIDAGEDIRDTRPWGRVGPQIHCDREFLLGRLPHRSFFGLLAGEHLVGLLVNERSEITSMMEHNPFLVGFNHQERCSGAGIPVEGQNRRVV